MLELMEASIYRNFYSASKNIDKELEDPFYLVKKERNGRYWRLTTFTLLW